MAEFRSDTGPFANPTPSAAPGPSPTPTALSTPVQQSNAGAVPGAAGGAPPQAFINAVVAQLQSMIGSRYYLVSTDQLTAIATKMWNSVGLQSAWANYQLAATSSDPAVKQYVSALLQSFDTQVYGLLLNPQGDPSVDPSIIQDYANAKQSAGESLSTAELTALSNATQAANAPVPNPFGQSVKVSGYDYGAPEPKGGWSSKAPGESYGWPMHLGVDYGTTAGDRIVSPFAGTVVAETGVAGYGNIVYVRLDNGWTIGFGHVGSISVQNGARVNPGDLIAIAGANVGSAVGSVTIGTWQDPSGKFVNPHNVMDPIFTGTTFSAAGIPGAAGTGAPTVNTALDTKYPTIKRDFTQYFGTPPSPEDVFNILQHGNTPQQWTDYIRSMTSQISGLTMGQAYDMRQMVDNTSLSLLGHAGTDGMVKDMFDRGFTSQQGIQFWIGENSPSDIDKQTYSKIVKANQPYMANVLNDNGGFDPRVAKEQAVAARDRAKRTTGTQNG